MQVPKVIAFSVSATKKVKFAPGNLQATTTDLGEHWTWNFAENQWDYVGDAAANNSINGNGTVSENGTVDRFGWSTASTYLGIHNFTNDEDCPGAFVDWGSHPVVIEGIGSGWRTLTEQEWEYLINTRVVKGGSGEGYTYTLGQKVNGVSGYVFYPDNYTGEIYTGTDWSSFENAGCMFLPISECTCYWTSTPYDDSNSTSNLEAKYVYSYHNKLHTYYSNNRFRKYYVRLVRDVE